MPLAQKPSMDSFEYSAKPLGRYWAYGYYGQSFGVQLCRSRHIRLPWCEQLMQERAATPETWTPL